MGATVGIAGMESQRLIDRDRLHDAMPCAMAVRSCPERAAIGSRIEPSPTN